MIFKRNVYVTICLLALGVALWLLRGCERKQESETTSQVLGPTDRQKIVIDEKHHTVTTITQTGSTTQYLPPGNAGIVIKKDGTSIILGRTSGTEFAPFIGFSYSDQARLTLGIGLLYWHRWELGMTLNPTMSGRFSLTLAPVICYTLYSNTSLFVGVDTRKSPIGGISFKF